MIKYNTLQDQKANGKPQPWRPKKVRGLVLSDSYKRLGFTKKADRVRMCSNLLEFGVDGDENKTLINANFCRDRLCPLCSWRRSIKVYGQVKTVIDQVDSNLKPLFLTLTIKNCTADELENTIDHFMKSFKRFTNDRKFKRICKGFFRALEITYNNEKKTFHPHIHMVIYVDQSYFDKALDNYMHTSDWAKLWGKKLRVDYVPITDVRVVKNHDNARNKIVCEVAKYTMKDSAIFSDIKDENEIDFVVAALEKSLKHKRLFAFGGELKEVAKNLLTEELGEGDLIDPLDENAPTKFDRIECYRWSFHTCNFVIDEWESQVATDLMKSHRHAQLDRANLKALRKVVNC